jgi:zinc D-Ala-D-Ala carboxypeptidase
MGTPGSYALTFPRARLIHSDVAAKHDIDNEPPPALEHNLQTLSFMLEFIQKTLQAKHPGLRLAISSGYRCQQLNAEVGGSKTSDHMKGLAADITCNLLTPFELANEIVEVTRAFNQLIIEFGRWVHISVPQPGQVAKEQLLTARRAGSVVNGSVVYKTVYLPGLKP